MQDGKSMWDKTIRDLLGAAESNCPDGGMLVTKLLRAGTDPVAALIFIVGSDEVSEVVDAVRQLPIWQEGKKEPRSYVDESDRVVFVAAVRGTGRFGVFARGAEEGDLEMISRKVPTGTTLAETQKNLDAYAEKKNWITVPTPESLRKMLEMVMKEAPEESSLSAWTDLEKAQAAMWAVATHMVASDNPLSVPPMPNCLVMELRKGAGAI
jgi:hypothetical protein